MINVSDIRSSIARYLAGEYDLRELNSAAASMRYEAGRAIDPEPDALLAQVEGRLAEYQHGDWTEEEMREWLRPLAWHYTVESKVAPSNGQATTVLDGTIADVVMAEVMV